MNIFRFLIPKSLSVYISSDSTARQALEKMRAHRYSALPVLDRDGKYVGTVRADDILYLFASIGSLDEKDAEKHNVTDIMQKGYNPPIDCNATVMNLAEAVKEHNFIPVTDDRGCFIGIILRRDVLNFLLGYYLERNPAETGSKEEQFLAEARPAVAEEN